MFNYKGKYSSLAIILLYLVIIFPQLNNHISPNNHNCVITLTTIENWDAEGITNHNFNLIHSWNNPGDLGVHYYERVMNKEGRNYFVSYPPFSTILIYPFIKLFPSDFYPLAYKLFGVLVHILTFLSLLVLFKKIGLKHQLFRATLFLLFPASIVLSGMYYPEQLILLLIVVFVLLLTSKSRIIGLCLVSILLVYTDWLGCVIIGLSPVIYLFKRSVLSFKQLISIVIGGLFGGFLLVYQYSTINGWEGLVKGLKIRYIERAGLFPEVYSDQGVNLFSTNSIYYVVYHLGPLLLVTIGLMLLFKSDFKSLNKQVLFFILTPIVIHFIVLFNSNILHFQNLSKLGLVLCFIPFNITSSLKTKFISIVFFIYSFIVVQLYWNKYPVQEKIYEKASEINRVKSPNKAIVLKQKEFTEELVLLSYLTKRNLVWAKDSAMADSMLPNRLKKDFILIENSNP